MTARGEAAARPRRTGRRPGDSGTRDAILRAARKLFAERGYGGATIRGIALEAGVDAALIHHFFESKEGVFAAAMEDAIHPGEMMDDVIGPGVDGLGERLVRTFIAAWEDESKREPLLAMLRSAVTQEEAARLLRQFIAANLYERIAGAIGEGDAAGDRQLRATLIGSQLIGMALLRYVIQVDPLASAPTETLVAWLTPTIQAYLTADHDELIGATAT